MPIRPVSWLRQALRRGLANTLPPRVFIARGSRRSQAVCLTFDDGPHPELTPRLLDVLAQLQVRATFFLIGREIEKYPAVAQRIIGEGHCVGHHSYSHRPRATLTVEETADEMFRGAEALRGILGSTSRFFRPPAGKLTARDLLRFWKFGLTTVLWNVDPKDYNKKSADEVRSTFQKRPLEAGDLVLLHDNHPHAIEILPDLVASARKSGLEFVTVEAWTK